MIANESIEQAAYEVMCKAAIDIPEDYLGGIKGMVRREEGTLSCFVLRSMVEKLGSGERGPATDVRRYGPASLLRQGGQRGARRGRVRGRGAGASLRHRARHPRRAAQAEPRASPVAHRSRQQRRNQRAGDRMELRARRGLGRDHHRAQGRPVRHRLPHALPGRRHRRHQAVSTSILWWRSASAGSRASPPSSGSVSAAPRTSRWCSASRPRACAPSATGTRTRRSRHWNWSSRTSATASGWGRWASLARRWSSTATSRSATHHTGGMPMSVHTFCLSSRRATARVGADGAIGLRTDPGWFTPYMRRETVDWASDREERSRESV